VIYSLSNEQCKRALHRYHGAERPSDRWVAAEGPYMKALQDFVSSIDPTRILTHAGGHDFNGVAPTYNWHYCSPRGAFLNWRKDFKKPFLIGEWEFGWYSRPWTEQRVRDYTDLCLRIARAYEISGVWPMAILKWCMWGSYGDTWKQPGNRQITIDLEWTTMDGPFMKPRHPWRPHVNAWNDEKPRIKPGHLYELVRAACAPNMVFLDIVDTITAKPKTFHVFVVNDYPRLVKLHLAVEAQMAGRKLPVASQAVTLGPAEVKRLRIDYPDVDRKKDREVVFVATLRKGGPEGPIVNTHRIRTLFRKLAASVKVDLPPRWLRASKRRDSRIRGPFLPLDLGRFCNRGFSDPTPGDGRGGWTQQGPSNDLHRLPGGDHRFAGIPVRIIHEAENRSRSMIFLKSQRYPDMPKQVGPIPVMRRVTAIHFLHAAAWSRPHQKVGAYRIRYRDGTSAYIPVVIGRNIDDWWDPKDLPGAQVAWKGLDDKGIYLTTWTNPHPDKPVDWILVLSKGVETAWGLIAVTVLPVHRPAGPAESLRVDDFAGKTRSPWEEVPWGEQGFASLRISEGVGTFSFAQHPTWGIAGLAIPVSGAHWARKGAKALALRLRNPEKQAVLNARRNRPGRVDQGVVDRIILRLCDAEGSRVFECAATVSNADWQERTIPFSQFGDRRDPAGRLGPAQLAKVAYLEILVRGNNTWTHPGWHPFRVQIDWMEAR